METGVAIIGLGIMGTRMLGSLTASDAFSPIAAWDPSEAARTAAATAFPDLGIASAAATAIATPDVDVVYIACPPAAHVEYAVMAADAGKAIYCEKPLAVELAEAEQLVDLVASRGLVNAVNFPFGAARSVDFIEAQLARGARGDIVGVDLRLHFLPSPGPGSRTQPGSASEPKVASCARWVDTSFSSPRNCSAQLRWSSRRSRIRTTTSRTRRTSLRDSTARASRSR